MAKEIKWAIEAKEDLSTNLRYWELRNKSNAYSDKLNSLIERTIALIQSHPYIGRELDNKNVRMKSVKNYFLVYEITQTSILVLRIWDSRQNPNEFLY